MHPLLRIKRYYLDLKIGGKLLFVYLSAFLLPYLLMCVFGYTITRNTLVERVRDELDNEVSIVRQGIESQIERCLEAAYTVVFDRRVQLLLQDEYQKSSDMMRAYAEIRQRMDSVMTINTGIASFTIFTNNPTLPGDTPYLQFLDDDTRAQDWLIALASGERGSFVYAPQMKSVRSGNSMILKQVATVYMRLPYYMGGYNELYYRIDIDLDSLRAFLTDAGRGREMLLANEENVIVASNAGKHFGVALGDRFTSVDGIAGASGWFETRESNRSGGTLIARYQSLRNGWKIISLVSYDSFLADAQRRSVQFVGISLLFLSVLVVLLLLTTRIWTRRIDTLTTLMKQLERGDFGIDAHFEGGDEFDDILRSFIHMSDQIGTLIDEGYAKEVAKKQTELNNLQSMINPHFLYNTLSSIRAIANKNGDREAGHMIDQLARFYRIVLSKGSPFVTVREEFALLECYLDIQRTRFSDRFTTRYDIDEAALSCRVLKLILQPFVENSISHAMQGPGVPLGIEIRVARDKDTIMFQVSDDGAGFDLNGSERKDGDGLLSGGFGIRNVDDRIKLRYGPEYGVSIESQPGVGTRVSIRVPAFE